MNLGYLNSATDWCANTEIKNSINRASLQGPDIYKGIGKNVLKIVKSHFTDLPVIENDMLAFRDDEHLFSYFSYLDNAIIIRDQSSETNISQDPDDILEAIEKSIGFLSLRSITEAAFQKLNEIGWARLRDIPEKHFIPDLVLKSVLNANSDVKTGGYVTHFINRDYAATISARDQHLLAILHALPVDTSISTIKSLKAQTDGFFEIRDFSGSGTTIANASPGAVVIDNLGRVNRITSTPQCKPHPTTGCYIWFDSILSTGTGPFLTMQIDNLCINAPGTTNNPMLGATTFEINWGDGSPIQTYPIPASTITGYISPFWTYSVPRTYTITITANNASYPCTATCTTSIEVPSSCILGINKGSYDIWTYSSDLCMAMRCSNWVRQWAHRIHTALFGYHQSGASTYAFQWRADIFGNYAWRAYRADKLIAQYAVYWLGFDCATPSTDNANTSPTNVSSAQVEQTNNNDLFGWSSIDSYHVMYITGYPPLTLNLSTFP